MREIAGKHQERLSHLKKMVESWNEYFGANNQRYWEMTKFVFASNLSSTDISSLNTLKKPTIQFNVLEAFVSKLRSQFVKQEPSFEVRAADGVPLQMLTEEFIATEKVVEGYLRAIFDDAANDGLQSNIHTDQLAGGFSAVWIRTDYVNEYSFEQNIIVERVFDPTLCIWDPLARTSHKGDGGYCGMLVPYTKEKFIQEYGEKAAEGIKFQNTSAMSGFTWSYKNQKEDIILVAYMFEKKSKKRKIVKLSNGDVVPLDNYKELLTRWDDITQPPIILDERETDVETIVHYQFCENKVLSYEETDYKYLPIVFVDGNSTLVKGDTSTSQAEAPVGGSSSGATQQMTRPYVYNAIGAQRAMNYAGQTIAGEIENMVMHKWVVALEAIPTNDKYLSAYTNPQEASVLVYNAFDSETGQPLEGPREIQRTQTPPIVENTFMNSVQTIQATLGSYDAQQGNIDPSMSGKAIMQGAMQADGAAGPYLINYIKAWNRIGQVVIDLIPKYYKTPRSLPVIDMDGKRRFQIVNAPKDMQHQQAQDREQQQQGDMNFDTQGRQEQQSVSLSYEPHTLQLRIEAGVNSAVQKQIAMDQVIRLSASNEAFQAFINERGLPYLLDNLEIRNIDSLKVEAEAWMQDMRAQKEAAAQQPSPQQMEMETIKQIEMAKVAQRQQQAEGELAVKAANVAVAKEKNEIEFERLLAEIGEFEANKAMAQQKTVAEESKAAVDLAIEVAKLQHEQSESKGQE